MKKKVKGLFVVFYQSESSLIEISSCLTILLVVFLRLLWLAGINGHSLSLGALIVLGLVSVELVLMEGSQQFHGWCDKASFSLRRRMPVS